MDKEDSKSRGMKHRTNKKKYNKNKPAVHVPSSKPKIALESNWGRYEVKESEHEVTSSTDFSVLANAPITRGSHFQFKSDKEIMETSEPVTSSLFNLDLVLLEKSLATIPFNIRSGISEDAFSGSQQRVMTFLKDNINDYDAYLRSHQRTKPDVVFGSDGDLSGGDSDVDQPKEEEPPKISVSESPLQREEPEAVEGDLEQWLDDILDD